MKKILIVVDMQNDFIDGSLGTPEAEAIGNIFENVSGYRLADVPFASSFAGYKDWFLQEYRNPGYTIEAGIGQNPLPISQFNEIYNANLGILVLGAVL